MHDYCALHSGSLSILLGYGMCNDYTNMAQFIFAGLAIRALPSEQCSMLNVTSVIHRQATMIKPHLPNAELHPALSCPGRTAGQASNNSQSAATRVRWHNPVGSPRFSGRHTHMAFRPKRLGHMNSPELLTIYTTDTKLSTHTFPPTEPHLEERGSIIRVEVRDLQEQFEVVYVL